MISCEGCKRQLDLYIFEDETAIDKQEIEAHLASCPTCREEAEVLLRMKETLSTMPRIEVGPEFKAELNAKIDRMETPLVVVPKKKRFYRDWRAYSALAACVMLAVVLKTNVFDATHQLPTEPDSVIPQTFVRTMPDSSELNVASVEPTPVETATDAPVVAQPKQKKKTATPSPRQNEPAVASNDAVQSVPELKETEPGMASRRMMPEPDGVMLGMDDAATTDQNMPATPDIAPVPDVPEIGTGGGAQDAAFSPEVGILYVDAAGAEQLWSVAVQHGIYGTDQVTLPRVQVDAFLEAMDGLGVLYDASMLCGDPVTFQIQEKSFE